MFPFALLRGFFHALFAELSLCIFYLGFPCTFLRGFPSKLFYSVPFRAVFGRGFFRVRFFCGDFLLELFPKCVLCALFSGVFFRALLSGSFLPELSFFLQWFHPVTGCFVRSFTGLFPGSLAGIFSVRSFVVAFLLGSVGGRCALSSWFSPFAFSRRLLPCALWWGLFHWFLR